MSQFTGSTFGNYSRFIFFLLGGIFVALGIGMFVTLGTIPFAGGTMQLTGGIFVVVGIILIVAGLLAGRGASRTNQILQTGIPGTATITGLTQTGMTFNDNPQISMNLLVQLPGEVPYAATHREIVPLMLLGRLSSGAPLSVKVDQMDRSKIVIDWSGTGFAAPQAGAVQMPAAPTGPGTTAGSGQDESLAQVQAALMGNASGAAPIFANPAQANLTVEQLRAYLRQNGLDASARVDSMADSGQTVGDERVYDMEMTLKIPGKPDQKLPKSRAMIPVSKSHKLFQGMTVPVKYEATNPDLLMVDWDKI
jgi:hypothetical protein